MEDSVKREDNTVQDDALTVAMDNLVHAHREFILSLLRHCRGVAGAAAVMHAMHIELGKRELSTIDEFLRLMEEAEGDDKEEENKDE